MLRLRPIFAVLVAAVLAGCAKTEPTPPSAASAATHILRVAQRNEPASLDPASVTLPDEFGTMRTLLEGLLIPGIDGGPPRPGAAELYNVSIDGRTYTFFLRPDAVWSDGVPVSSAHFLASYRRMLTPETAAPKASVFFPIKNARAFATGQLKDFGAVGIKAPDARTLVLTLERPNARFPYYVASGPYLPVRADVIAKHGRKWTLPENYVGNGPFTLAEWRADQRIVVRKNPTWHDADRVQLDAIHFVRFDSGDSEERAYRAGQIHVTMSVPFSKVATHTAERPAELQRASLIDPRYLSFNTTRPPLNDPRVRRALSLALDRNKLVERVLQGGQLAASRIVPPSLRETDDNTPLPAAHRYDPAAARQAGKSGSVLLNCVFSATGRLGRCETISESPSAAGFGLVPGRISLVSQSGAFGGYCLSLIRQRGLGLNLWVTTGNQSDVDFADCVSHFAQDEGTQVIVGYIEAATDKARLIAALELARDNGKRIVVMKVGSSEAGAQAAASHTGSLAGSTASWSAGFKRAGMLEVGDFDALLETAGFFAKASPPKARGVGIVTPSGGAGIMAADHAEFAGLPLPQPAPATERVRCPRSW